MNIDVKILLCEHYDQSLPLPKYETNGSAGMDIRACFPHKDQLTIDPYERVLIPTGLKFAIPEGYEMQVRPRSGLSLKTGLLVTNSPGTIDSDYRGELQIIIGNLGENHEIIRHGDRIAQILFAPVIRANLQVVSELGETARGSGGFGSTGIK